jgi:hypothetical protein
MATRGRPRGVVVHVSGLYAPIFAIRYGLGLPAGGALVSLGSTFQLLAPLWGRLAGLCPLRPVYDRRRSTYDA